MNHVPKSDESTDRSGIGLAATRFFIALPLACAALYSGVIAFAADNLRTDFPRWKAIVLIALFALSSGTMAIGAYMTWVRKPRWGWWFVASMVAYMLVAQLVRALR